MIGAITRFVAATSFGVAVGTVTHDVGWGLVALIGCMFLITITVRNGPSA